MSLCDLIGRIQILKRAHGFGLGNQTPLHTQLYS